MKGKSVFFYKILVVGVIVLFVGVSYSSAFSIKSIDHNNINYVKESDNEEWLATMSIDFGYEIYNDEVIYLNKTFYPDENYFIELFINFDIPYNETKKVYIEYWINAHFVPFGRQPPWVDYILWEQNSTFVNSSPEDIYVKECTRIEPSIGCYFVLNLHLFAFIDVYEYDGNDWVKVDEDVSLKDMYIRGFSINPRERTFPTMEFIYRNLERFPNMEVLLRIMKLLR